MALKQIKNKIRATQRTGQVTKAMEAVSAVKMRKSQEQAIAGRAYATTALRILKRISASVEGSQLLFAQKREVKRRLFIVITSDKGLAGNLNNGVLKATHEAMEKHKDEEVGFICVGRKAHDHFAARGYTIEQQYINISDEVTREDMEEIATYATDAFKAGTYDAVSISYQNFISTFEQEPVVRRIFPLSHEAITEIVKGITPTHGLYADHEVDITAPSYMIESDAEAVLSTLIPDIIKTLIYHGMIEAKASEHSARMVAMKNASDKAKEVTKQFTLQYNKARQAVITREVSEITGGIEAMRS